MEERLFRGGARTLVSREAASECSPRRKPWVKWEYYEQAPEGRKIIARRFNAGSADKTIPVPEGRLNSLRHLFVAGVPDGTRILSSAHPPLKWRATISGPSGTSNSPTERTHL
jgi:hypothetical protein